MRKLIALTLLLLTGCAPTSMPVMLSSSSSDAEPIPSQTAQIVIELAAPGEPVQVSRESLLTIKPNIVALRELYSLVGHPRASKNFTVEIALAYSSELAKLPHVVLVDANDGTVKLVSIYNHNNDFFSLDKLRKEYGEPVLADTISSRDHLFFIGRGVAAIVESRDNTDIWYVQLLPERMTLEEYQGHQGYWQETFAFTP